MLAWHFTSDRLRDGSPIPKPGQKLIHTAPLALCSSGFHASLEPFDALQNAPGSNLHLVECSGQIIHGDDKLVCSERTIIVSMQADPLLRYFARMRALSVVHLENPADCVLDFLMGDDAARDAACDAAWVAAWSTARDAACDVACDAARGAAWSSIWASTWIPTRDVAWDAVWNATRDAARAEFNSLVYEAFEDFLP